MFPLAFSPIPVKVHHSKEVLPHPQLSLSLAPPKPVTGCPRTATVIDGRRRNPLNESFTESVPGHRNRREALLSSFSRFTSPKHNPVTRQEGVPLVRNTHVSHTALLRKARPGELGEDGVRTKYFSRKGKNSIKSNNWVWLVAF